MKQQMILSRDEAVNCALLQTAIDMAWRHGFDTERLVFSDSKLPQSWWARLFSC